MRIGSCASRNRIRKDVVPNIDTGTSKEANAATIGDNSIIVNDTIRPSDVNSRGLISAPSVIPDYIPLDYDTGSPRAPDS